MRTIVGILIAGAMGALLRYAVDGAVSRRISGAFPWGTLVINISGSLLLGIVFVITTERMTIAPWLRTSLTIGLLGAYTTFSTLSLETVRLLEDRVYLLALANVVGTMVAGLAAVAVGMALGRSL